MPPRTLATNLDAALDKLMEQRDLLHRIRVGGGRSEFFVGWFLRSEAGETFSHLILAKMADLGIDLSFDNYHDPELPDGEPIV